MNNFLKFATRSALTKISNTGKYFPKFNVGDQILTPAYSRTLWHMCSIVKSNNFLKYQAISEKCSCGCSGMMHTGGEKDLVSFLQNEISLEKKSQKMISLPAELDGFAISSDQAELTFKKETSSETILVTMNVNHSVDTEEVGDDGNFVEEMKSKPSFEVDIVRKNKTLNFACSFIDFDEARDPDASDIYEINEVTYFEGNWEEKTYSVAADLLDENLYDLFMTVLHDKGITKKFIERVSEIATSHEHSQYIGLLENVKKFSSVN